MESAKNYLEGQGFTTRNGLGSFLLLLLFFSFFQLNEKVEKVVPLSILYLDGWLSTEILCFVSWFYLWF